MSDTVNHQELFGQVVSSTPFDLPVVYLVTGAIILLTIFSHTRKTPDLPLLNPAKFFDILGQQRANHFNFNARQLLDQGRTRYPGQPFRIVTNDGDSVAIPPSLVDEVSSHPSMVVPHENVTGDRVTHIPGFEPFRHVQGLPAIVNRVITRNLGAIVPVLSEASGQALRHGLSPGNNAEGGWATLTPVADLPPIVARVSTRVFSGEEMSKNAEWTAAATEYASLFFAADDTIRSWPQPLRATVARFLPICQRLRAALDRARRARGDHQADVAGAGGLRPPGGLDKKSSLPNGLDFGAEAANDPVGFQILLSFVAIHTTSDLLGETMIRIAENPHLFDELREEVARAVKAHGGGGLTKAVLGDLQLMDSVIKEAQRMKPILLAPMRRGATRDVTLSNGVRIPKGQLVFANSLHMHDAEVHADPDVFVPGRFLPPPRATADDPATSGGVGAGMGRQRQQQQLVNTSASHLGFGHGRFACPGRFFAADELKVLLCHLLAGWEWEMMAPTTTTMTGGEGTGGGGGGGGVDGAGAAAARKFSEFGFFATGDSATRIRIRGRETVGDLRGSEL